MARALEKLSPVGVRNTNKPGMYGDGGGLWLHVGPNALDENGKPTKTGKSWIFRFMLNGRAREMGLGPVHTIGLTEAREKAKECRKLVLDGNDPLEARHARRKAQKLEAAKAITFQTCAGKYITANRAAWRNEKHADQWENTLATYVYPVIGSLSVGEIDKRHANGALRAAIRLALRREGTDHDIMPILGDVSDPWAMDKDGKHWFGECKRSWPEYYDRLMRK